MTKMPTRVKMTEPHRYAVSICSRTSSIALVHKKLYSQTVALLLMTKHMVSGLINPDESHSVLVLCLVRVKG